MFIFVLLCFILLPFYFYNHLEDGEKFVLLLLLSYGRIVTKNILWLFLTVLWVVLLCMIVIFPSHTHFFFIVL